VFLLQAHGRRRWRIGRARDRNTVKGAPLAVLARFEPEQEWICEPGDILYLPPGYAHDGVAVDECITCSIGFRAPDARELVPALLERVEDSLAARASTGRYADPDLAPARRPGEIPSAMAVHARRIASSIRLDDVDVDIALGRHLSEPKPHVAFEPPAQPLGNGAFTRAARAGVRLDLRSRLLYRRGRFFMNGELLPAPAGTRALLEQLADARRLAKLPARAPGLYALLYQWYCYGWLHPGTEHGTDA
jgi:50S ribosomal protein L16 3-hydroxylase